MPRHRHSQTVSEIVRTGAVVVTLLVACTFAVAVSNNASALPPRKVIITDPGDLCPDYLRRIKARADEQFQDENFDKAIEMYTGLIEKEPKCIVFLMRRAECYAMLKKMEPALKDMTRVVELRPNRDYGYLARGRFYENLGKDDLAMKDYQMAVKLGGITGYKDQAHILERRGDYKTAADYVGRYIRSTRPLSAIPFYFDRARLYDKMGRKDLGDKDRKFATDLVNSSGGHQIDKYRR